MKNWIADRLRHAGSWLAASAFVLGAGAAQAYVTTAADAAGTRLFRDGAQTFRFVGANINELPWANDQVLAQDLDYARNLGARVVRVWGVNSASSVDEMDGRLRRVLDAAQQRGLYVIVALTHNYWQDNWMDDCNPKPPPPQPERRCPVHAVPGDDGPNAYVNGYHGFYSVDASPHWLLSDAWVHWGHGAYYKPYVENLVARLKNHPALFAWDIANEVGVSNRSDPFLSGILTDFYVNMAATIKSRDPNHMVTTGLISSKWAGFSAAQRNRVYGSRDIDFVTIHQYEGEPADPYEDQDEEVRRASIEWQKPIIVEEYGAHATDAEVAKRKIDAYFSRRLTSDNPNERVAGILYWGISSYSFYQGGIWVTPIASWLEQRMPAFAALANQAVSNACGALFTGRVLSPNASITSCNGRYRLVMQTDGNLVLYRVSDGAPRWSSRTGGRGSSNAALQADGNFVIYAGSAATWTSNTSGKAVAAVFVQNDGNVVMYGYRGEVFWTTNTRE